MKARVFLILAIVVGLSAGCNTKGEPVDFAKACDLGNDKKTIEISGILDDKGGLYCSNTSGRMECGFKLLQKAGDDKGISSDIEVGSGSNTVDKIESSYKSADLKIRDNAGAPVKVGDNVKLTGKLTTAPDPVNGGVCFLQVYKIER